MLFNMDNWTSRAHGFNIATRILLPIREIIRRVWVVMELVLVALDLILSVIAIANGTAAGYLITHLVFISIALLLSLEDFRGLFCVFQCALNCTGSCKGCLSFKRKYDFGCAVLTELILTPLLLTDIFDVVIGQGYRGDAGTADKLGFAVFIIDVMCTIGLVYFARLAILISAVVTTDRLFTASTVTQKSGNDVSNSRQWSKLFCLLGFLIHTAGQFLVHISMLVAIGFVLIIENQHLYNSEFENEGYHTSGYLIYMCVAVCFLPFFGHFSYFILANFWANEFSLSLICDFVKLF